MPMDPSIAPLRTYLLQSGPPWLRWGARMVDMWLLVLLLGALPINVDSFVSFDVTALQRMLPGFLLILRSVAPVEGRSDARQVVVRHHRGPKERRPPRSFGVVSEEFFRIFSRPGRGRAYADSGVVTVAHRFQR
jgi:hypothetical protein